MNESTSAAETDNQMMDRKTRVSSVHFDGLSNTNPIIFNPIVSGLMKPNSLGDVIEAIGTASARLKRLDIFKSINFKLEKSHEFEGEIDIIINVVEKGRFELRTETQIGNQEGDLVISGKARNCAGRAEVLSGIYSVGTLTTSSFQLAFTKPLKRHCHSFDLSAHKTIHNLQSFRSHHEVLRGAALNYKRATKYGEHDCTYNATWRELCSPGPNASWAVRSQMGHTLKSSIKHTFTRDLRDNPGLSTGGYRISLTQELAGLGGDASFFKAEGDIQKYIRLHHSGLTLSLGARAGALWATGGTSAATSISDRYFLGGAMSMRGFNMAGIGPRDRNDSLGGDAFWATGIQIRSPIPLLQKSTGDTLQLHSFFNAGSLANFSSDSAHRGLFQRLKDSPLRASTGVGLILQMGPARLEFNYCLPVMYAATDLQKRGFQLGVGLNFL
ncbi:hypothetical protein SARC_10184 [Sphaeroforma arctica JP610]|uniref:Bacterial surface antigen (D15) domain-containing protein n=1 Tax=Sphaeroforma arctica JP610 TaxID=667725 RepID=A0A0L0FKP4_9EUKA|nr:hypothetical protein SARC_10184 [Sphaeroforma arctica JP610]KNC77357.1 hypothetical protein SARC_10184 [Sphaeroforma arctica JP610]|eukprot:XP_014151259.1 hypothetical protein SARC_10184 [Sphaeroforma arctica JP610]